MGELKNLLRQHKVTMIKQLRRGDFLGDPMTSSIIEARLGLIHDITEYMDGKPEALLRRVEDA